MGERSTFSSGSHIGITIQTGITICGRSPRPVLINLLLQTRVRRYVRCYVPSTTTSITQRPTAHFMRLNLMGQRCDKECPPALMPVPTLTFWSQVTARDSHRLVASIDSAHNNGLSKSAPTAVAAAGSFGKNIQVVLMPPGTKC